MTVRDFIGERCHRSPEGRVAVLELWDAYVAFCKEKKLKPAAPQEFLERMAAEGFKVEPRYVEGVKLLA
jgi:hypothetical protein